MGLLIKNGRLIDAKNNIDQKRDILIETDKIAEIGDNLSASNAEIFDANGLTVVPGLIDMHVHLREPGFEYKETIYSGTQAAARGGFTSLCCMPNTNPVADNPGVIEFILSQNKKAAFVNLFPIGAVSKGLKGEELSEIADLKSSAVVALSDDGNPIENPELMRRAMEYAAMFDLPIISHCEDRQLSAGGVMHEGYISTRLGLKGIPRTSEIVVVARDIEIARFTNSRLHVAHISCKESVELIRKAKSIGLKISCECCPHHFTLTQEALINYDTNTKVNPPLRTQEDIAALKEGLKDGTIDCIATDHAPHAEEDKDLEFDSAPFGIIGLETALGLVVSELVDKGIISWKQLVEKMSLNPSNILGLSRGSLEKGAVADITIIDPKQEWTVRKEGLVSKSKNSPFIGRRLRGKAVLTVVSGRIVYKA
ncbi:MAG: dihydroorotase [Candidatus Omnitrophota bacterium]